MVRSLWNLKLKAQDQKDGVDSSGIEVADATANDEDRKCKLCKKIPPEILLCMVGPVPIYDQIFERGLF